MALQKTTEFLKKYLLKYFTMEAQISELVNLAKSKNERNNNWC